jgi:hypothetical protein
MSELPVHTLSASRNSLAPANHAEREWVTNGELMAEVLLQNVYSHIRLHH